MQSTMHSVTWHHFFSLFTYHLFHSCKVVLFSSSIFLFPCVLFYIFVISVYLIFVLCLCYFVSSKCAN
jgi:hypothetical protein